MWGLRHPPPLGQSAAQSLQRQERLDADLGRAGVPQPCMATFRLLAGRGAQEGAQRSAGYERIGGVEPCAMRLREVEVREHDLGGLLDARGCLREAGPQPVDDPAQLRKGARVIGLGGRSSARPRPPPRGRPSARPPGGSA